MSKATQLSAMKRRGMKRRLINGQLDDSLPAINAICQRQIELMAGKELSLQLHEIFYQYMVHQPLSMCVDRAGI